MKQFSKLFGIILLSGAMVLSSCGASNTVKGTGIGAGAGAALGAGIGAIFGGSKGAAWGAGAGAVVGGTSGAILGKKMDTQAKELAAIENAQVEKLNDGEAIKVTFESGLLYATNSSTLNNASRASLDKFATSLLNNPDTDVKIYGHTDSTGNANINNPLSEQRAKSGVSGARLESAGFGSSQPISDNATVEGRAQNRRVEVYILPDAKMIEDAQKEAQ